MPGKRNPNGPVPNIVKQKKYRDKLRATNSVPLFGTKEKTRYVDTLIRDHDRMRDSEIPEL